MRTLVIAFAALTLALALGSGVAFADVISMEEDACSGKKLGDSCTVEGEGKGACVESKCYRNDYSNGPPPTTVEEDCLKCEVGAEPEGSGDEEEKGGCSVATLTEPGPLSGLSLLAGAGIFGLLLRRRRSATD